MQTVAATLSRGHRGDDPATRWCSRRPSIRPTRSTRTSSRRRRRSSRSSRKQPRAPRGGALPHPQLRLPADGEAGARRRAALRHDRAGRGARAAHALAHLHAGRALEGLDRRPTASRRASTPTRTCEQPARLRLHGLRAAAARRRTRRPREVLSARARRRRASVDHLAAAYAYAAMPARLALERGAWADAAKLALAPAADAYPWKKYPQAEALNAFARGIGAAMSGDAAGGRGRGRAARRRCATPRRSTRSPTGPTRSTSRRRSCAAWPACAGGKKDEGLARCAPRRTARTPSRSTSSRRV